MTEVNINKSFSSGMIVTEAYTVWDRLSLPPNGAQYKWMSFVKTGYKAIAIAYQSSDTSSIVKINDSLDSGNYLDDATVVVRNLSTTDTIITTVTVFVTYIKI